MVNAMHPAIISFSKRLHTIKEEIQVRLKAVKEEVDFGCVSRTYYCNCSEECEESVKFGIFDPGDNLESMFRARLDDAGWKVIIKIGGGIHMVFAPTHIPCNSVIDSIQSFNPDYDGEGTSSRNFYCCCAQCLAKPTPSWEHVTDTDESKLCDKARGLGWVIGDDTTGVFLAPGHYSLPPSVELDIKHHRHYLAPGSVGFHHITGEPFYHPEPGGSHSPNFLRKDDPIMEAIICKPHHYTNGPIEVIDMIHSVIDSMKNVITPYQAFLTGTALKYLCRYGLKGGVEDLNKCKDYLNWLIEDMSNDK